MISTEFIRKTFDWIREVLNKIGQMSESSLGIFIFRVINIAFSSFKIRFTLGRRLKLRYDEIERFPVKADNNFSIFDTGK